jgi:TRAP-type C4-dicarboxylate transport system permease small subunit
VKKILKLLVHMVNGISNGLAVVSGITILVITLIVTVDVFMRYLLNRPLLFAGETCEFLMALIVFAGLAYTFQRGGHIRIELVIQRVPTRFRYWIRTATFAVGIIFLFIFAWQIFLFIKESYDFNRASTVLLCPIWIPQLSMLIGVIALILVLILAIVSHLGASHDKSSK